MKVHRPRPVAQVVDRARVCTLWTILAIALVATDALAERNLYTSQPAYRAALAAAGLEEVHEGFEDDDAWGHVRTTIIDGPATADSVSHLGVTWTGNSPAGDVTTSEGAAHSGSWGFYQSPHGNPTVGRNDGWVATHEDRFYAFGGWIHSNTPYANVIFVLDGDESHPVDFDEIQLGTAFLGVIDTAEFTSVEILETEAGGDEWKYIFGDDFRWGIATTSECVDGDADGYGAPASPACTYPEADCDDSDPAVNPGAAEIPGNGLDDDCDPSTPTGCSAER